MRQFLCVLALSAIGAAFISCSAKSKAMSMTSALDEADRYITQGYPRDALKILSSCEKKILSPMDAIGVYKRYLALEEKKSAEKILKKSLKKNPENLELNAVYASFLKKDGRFDEAFKRSKILRGTKYGGLHSEFYFRSLKAEEGEKPASFFWTEERMPGLYVDAYNSNQDNAWLRNAALCAMASGDYGDAEQLFPQEMQSPGDAYFWALVYYDNKKYGEAAECLLEAKRLAKKDKLELADSITEKRKISSIEIISLLSDSYAMMGEEKEAERVRGELIAELTMGQEKENEQEADFSSSLLATMYLNSALYALQKNDERAAYNTLTFLVQKWPDFVPALIAYGNFAYNSSKRIMDDPLTKSLRDAGVVSTDMKRFDDLPRVAVSDALLRMKESIERTHNDSLYVATLELEDKIDESSDERIRLGRMYRVLERNAIAADLFPAEIAQYAVHTLLRLEHYQEAKDMFLKYITARYNLGKERPFEEDLVLHLNNMDLWEVEYGAYFAAKEKDTDLTKRLYEYAVYESGFSSSNGGTEISPAAATQSAVNLAMFYSSTANKDKALELYGRAQSRASDNYLRSEIMYRLACIYDTKKDAAAAIKSLEYSLYLNPTNGSARLLLAKFKQ
ncbi:MAG: hypothetical protein K6A42_05270 [Treponema sp.]|nr:hypothetical protein [Treponema sp.]